MTTTLVTPAELKQVVLSELAAAHRKDVYMIAREITDAINPAPLTVGLIALTSVTRGVIESIPDFYGFTEFVFKEVIADIIRTPKDIQHLH